MKRFTRSLALLSFLCGSLMAADAAKKLNVLLITADDLGLNLSCYGEKRIATPKLDAFASEGVLFRSAYVAQSSCSSSRAAMLTGRWPHQCGQVGLAHLGFRMHPGQPTLPALLKAAGYRTGIIGKLHVEPAAEFPFDWMPKEKMAAPPTRDVRLVAERSREFFASAKAAGQPFFFYVNYFDPHGPLNKETDQVAGIPEKPLTAEDIKEPMPLNAKDPSKNALATARLMNTVLRLDVGMGLLLDELKAAGFADNTIVIYVGDNGTPMFRGKGTSYETGVRVPMLVRWPGVAKAGQSRVETVSLLDIMPTVLAAGGVKAPDTLVGAQLQPLLRGEPCEKWREMLFTEMNYHTPDVFNPQRTVRDRRYKLMLNLAPAEGVALVELFDLQSDPGENKNLADDPAHADARKKLEAVMQSWREKRADPLLDPARLQRWKDAAARWAKLPRVKAGPSMVVHIPEGDLDLLK